MVNKDGDLTSNPQEMAEDFNKFFINKVKDLTAAAVAASHDQGDPLEYVRRKLATKELPGVTNLRRITKKELRRIMSHVKSGRSTGAVNIDGYSLKLAYPLIEDSILHLVNLSLEGRRFARAWKPLTVAPHHKKGSRALLKNF